MNRRTFIGASTSALLLAQNPQQQQVEQWGLFEAQLRGPASGNPFVEVQLTARFKGGGDEHEVDGFYDGDGVYKIRYMPLKQGEWTFRTNSNSADLNGQTGRFVCGPPSSPGNHGPVKVNAKFHFAYADGTRYLPFGTTCYAWTHQGDALEQQTLETLKASGAFNKIRFCVFPKSYDYNKNEPVHYPFVKGDYTRINPACFRHLEQRVLDLQRLGIEADLILFHPYDRWGYSNMGQENDDRYLRYVIARLGPFRNVWWSVANEFNYVKTKTLADWDRFCQIIKARDPYQHLVSIHNGGSEADVLYDHGKPWISHVSIQLKDLTTGRFYREKYGKPIIYDECYYEGDLARRWGDISGEEMVRRFWLGTVGGCYVGHSETYLDPNDIIWWSKGGKLKGESAARIAFLRKILEGSPGAGLTPVEPSYYPSGMVDGKYQLMYLDIHRPRNYTLTLPNEGKWSVDVIDPWGMTVQPVEQVFSGKAPITLRARPYQALRITRVPG